MAGNSISFASRRKTVKRQLALLGMCIGIPGLLSACTIRSDRKISEEKIAARQEMFKNYLKEK